MRFNYIEPIIMIATIVRWLVLAVVTGVVVGSGASLFLAGLFYFSARTTGVSLSAQMVLLPIGGILNGLLLYYGIGIRRTAPRIP